MQPHLLFAGFALALVGGVAAAPAADDANAGSKIATEPPARIQALCKLEVSRSYRFLNDHLIGFQSFLGPGRATKEAGQFYGGVSAFF